MSCSCAATISGNWLFKGRGDAGVDLLPPAAQQGAVGRILHQSVLERILRIRRRSASENQFGVDELRQGIVQLLLGYRGNGADQLVRETRSPEIVVRGSR